jgi:2-iminobutanoate/2-iminopropanoate deaminase
MSERIFITEGPGIPKGSAPISQAVVAGNYCHISGQLPVDQNYQLVAGTILEQTQLAFDNLFAVLAQTGFTKDEIVFIDLAFSNLAELPEMNAYYDSLFEKGRKPARTIYEASALPLGAKIKVMAVAIKC